MPSAPWQPYSSTFLGDVSSILFDPYADLLWTGSSIGTVVSHFLPNGVGGSNDESKCLNRYTSFKSHSNRTPTRQLLISERAVLSLGESSVKSTSRRGLPHWFSQHAQDAQSMAFSSTKSNELVIAGSKPELITINTANGALIRKLDITPTAPGPSTAFSGLHDPTYFPPITHIRRSQNLVACGARSGVVTLRDPNTLKEEHSMMAHYAGLEQMETEGNYLVTCGLSLKQGHPVRDPLVKVFDVRALRPLPPITFPSIPSLIRFHPRMSSTLFIASSLGQLQILDIMNPIPANSFFQLDCGSYITDLCIAGTGEGLAYVDADSVVHLWTTGAASNVPHGPMKWSRATQPVELPDEPSEPNDSLFDWATDDTPLSTIGMPFYSSELLSVIPVQNYITPYSPLFQARPSIEPDLLSAVHQRQQQQLHQHHLHSPYQYSPSVNPVYNTNGRTEFEKVCYLPHSKKSKRYQASLPTFSSGAVSAHSVAGRIIPGVGKGPSTDTRRRLSIPLFRSEKEKEKEKRMIQGRKRRESAEGILEEETLSAGLPLEDFEDMPKWYRQVEIKYSKFGIEDFDFGFYNRTKYSGLETHIVNSYTNSLLQVLYHTLPVRHLAQSHITLTCSGTSCMLCELGFLFKMMDDAKGVNCQTTNFSRAFSINPRAIALALMDHHHQDFFLHRPLSDSQSLTSSPNNPHRSYSSLIQLCHHFLLEQMTDDARQQPGLGITDPVAVIYATNWRTEQVCPTCQHSSARPTVAKVVELVYPRRALSNESPPGSDLCTILRHSLARETTAKAACSHCSQHSHQRWRRVFDNQTCVEGREGLPAILALHAGVTSVEQLDFWLDSKQQHSHRFLQPEISIATRAGTAELIIGDDYPVPAPADGVRYELCSMVLQIEAEDEGPHLVALVKVADGGGWHLFNDFLVRKISEEEALGFPAAWKIPAVLYYRRKDLDKALDFSMLPTKMDRSILLEDINVSERRDATKIRHQVLTEDELPEKGALVAIDAEFVSLQEEEVDYRSDGTRIVRRPSRMTLARVSVLRGEGVKTGVPFIDDHIQTSEPITDYLTEYSGIRPGDLDHRLSPHTLVPLKVAYKKLRLLVDLGCTFIGHGLSKDFRIINIHVPPSQIIDTVDLYYIPSRQRRLSLRLLSFLILKHDIQNAGTHDSIEDARTALQLYEFYRQLANEGGWDEELEDVYRKGKAMGWKVVAAVPSTPMISIGK
ncbi:PAB-dependent poly(A)-specific ribonuclease subunit [Melampsora americana]|nr:PAB-dependent poly(A)-specific ribonuclease subunit [Melampsora americana]